MRTLRYAHLAPDLRHEAVERLSGMGHGHFMDTMGGGPEGAPNGPSRKSLRKGKNSAPRGTRTHDPLIKNQLLYQLSYRRPMCAAPQEKTGPRDRSL